MKLGIFSDTVGGNTPEEVAARTRALGVETVQLRLERNGLDLLGRAADRARVRRAYDEAGVTVAALAGYTNLLDPVLARRQANQEYLERLIAIAGDLGTSVVVTETGSYDPASSWNDHPRNHTAGAWAELVEVTGALVSVCECASVTLAYEPYVNSVLDSARAARRLADEIDSPFLSFVLDSAGLMTPRTIERNREITMAALELLRGRIALAHADDVRYEGGVARWRPLGWGDLDAETVLDGLAAVGFEGALIVEHLSESQAPEALAFCRERLARSSAAYKQRKEESRGHRSRVTPIQQ